VRRLVPTLFVLALLVATTAAFVFTERLKLQPAPITDLHLQHKIFAPACRCESASVRFDFVLRRRNRLRVSILDGDDHVVRRLVEDKRVDAGRQFFAWDGRDEAGRVVPEATYFPRVELLADNRPFDLPNPIRVDRGPPTLHADIRPTVISPDGDGHNDRVSVRYRQSERGRPFLVVDGQREVRALASKRVAKIDWYGKRGGKALPPGRYSFVVSTRDVAGNLARKPVRTTIVVRYIDLARTTIRTRPRARIRVGVSTDARRFHWRLGARSGTAARGTLVVGAPAKPGRYRLVVSERGHRAAVLVIVRKAT
jgi:hypothetical protein